MKALFNKNANKKEYLRLPQIPTLFVLFMSFITIGFYSIYWLYKRTKIINEMVEKPISLNIIYPVMVSLMIYLVMSFIPDEVRMNALFDPIMAFAFLSYVLLTLFWLFLFSDRLKSLAMRSGFAIYYEFAVIFYIFYLQYMINKLHEKEAIK